MRAQEVVTIFSEIPNESTMKTYPELEEWFAKGMYVEKVVQSQAATSSKFIVTFILRYYNASLHREEKD